MIVTTTGFSFLYRQLQHQQGANAETRSERHRTDGTHNGSFAITQRRNPWIRKAATQKSV